MITTRLEAVGKGDEVAALRAHRVAGLWGPRGAGRWDEAQAQLECRGPPAPASSSGDGVRMCAQHRGGAQQVSGERRPVSTRPAGSWRSPETAAGRGPAAGQLGSAPLWSRGGTWPRLFRPLVAFWGQPGSSLAEPRAIAWVAVQAGGGRPRWANLRGAPATRGEDPDCACAH